MVKTFKPILTYSSKITYLEPDINNIERHIETKSNIYIIAQNTNGYETFLIQYLIHPNKINLDYYSLGKKYSNGDLWTKNIKANEWFNKLKDYDYLYLYNVDDNFIDKYGLYFACDKNDIKNKQVYKINKRNNKLELLN